MLFFFTSLEAPKDPKPIYVRKSILIISMLQFVCVIVFAQNESILSEINTIYTSVDTVVEVIQPKPDTIQIVEPEKKDTLELLFAENSIAVEPIDSNRYKDEVLFPEKQIPVHLYKHEKEWSKANLITNQKSYKTQHVLDTNYVTFGWHPYWMGTAYESYNFSLLSLVAYFSYEVNPQTGDYISVHNWKTTSLVDSVHAHGNKILLSVTNFGTSKNKKLLNNVKAQKNLIRNLITLLKERNADGVNIDFEGVRKNDKEELNNFLIDLSSSLKTENSNYIVSVAIPAFDFNDVYNIDVIASHVDYFVIMGYEFHGVTSKTAGPISPLSSGNRWAPLNLERSVDEYLVAGIPPSKLILSLSYYGVEWKTYDLKFPSKAKSFESYHTYKNIRNIIGDNNCVIDEPSLSKYYAYRDPNNNYRQIWFDDSLTLSMKYDWIKEKQIAGPGIWALGYDNGHTELWSLMAKKFAYNEDQMKSFRKKGRKMSFRRTLNLAFRLIKNPRSILTRPRPILMLFGGLAGVSMAGFLLIFRYGHRFGRMFKIALKGTVAIIIIIAFAVVFILFKYVKVNEVYYLLGGIILGLILFYFFSRRFISEKDLP